MKDFATPALIGSAAGAVLSLAVILSASVWISQPSYPSKPSAPIRSYIRVVDRQLLDAAQRCEVIETGRTAFDAGGVHYVAENIPNEYLGVEDEDRIERWTHSY